MIGSTQRALSPRPGGVRSATLPPLILWLVVAAVLLLMSLPRTALAQEALDSVRSLYASAAYDEALRALQPLLATKTTLAPDAVREVEEYRFLCLFALGRPAEARDAMAAVVKADPLYTLDENSTSPRILASFRDVRRELLPEIVGTVYASAKTAYDRKDFRPAEAQFKQVMALLDDSDMQGRSSDVRTLAKGFLDLSTSAIAAAETAAAAPPPTTRPGGTSAPTGTNTSASNSPSNASPPAPTPARPTQPANIVPPITLKQGVPGVPPDLARFGALREGVLEILIDEKGMVESARFTSPIHPVYDNMVLNATKAWRYEPAKADGLPVKYRKALRIVPVTTGREQNQQQN